MKGTFKPKIILLLVAVAMQVSAVIIPLSGSLSHSYAASLDKTASRSVKRTYNLPPKTKNYVVPQKVSTSTKPQVKGTGFGSVPYLPGPSHHVNIPSPRNVVRVPAPKGRHLATNATFEGQSEHGWQPSDSNGAGGLNNYIETVNEQWTVYSPDGTQQYGTTFDTWFGSPAGTNLFDPVVQWDNAGSRFMFIVDTGSSLLLSVAQQTSALGNYCNYTFTTPSGYFADYEKLGVDGDGVYFSVNLYLNDSNGPFSTNELFFVNRTQLETCATASTSSWQDLKNPDGSTAFAIVPARQDSSSNGIEYLVNSYNGGACQLTLWQLTSSGLLSNNTVNPQCYSPPPPAKQKGSNVRIAVGDNRLYQANFLDGMLTLNTVGSHDFGDGNGPVSIIEWFVLNASAGSVSSQGTFGTSGYWLFYPTTIRNSAGNMLFVYDVSGDTIYPSISYVDQTLSNPQMLASGASFYIVVDKSGTARWGDYSSAWLDPNPAQANSVWITSQYAKATNSWGTKVGNITP